MPVLVLALWLTRRRESRTQCWAFWLTTRLISGSGILLDLFFGLSFFTFPNHGAVLGIQFYGYSFANGWQKIIPIEAVGFYVFGTLAALLIYIWRDAFWFAAYNVADGPRRQIRLRNIFSFHRGSAILATFIFLLGYLY